MGKKENDKKRTGPGSEKKRAESKEIAVTAPKKTTLDIMKRSEHVNMGLPDNTARTLAKMAGGGKDAHVRVRGNAQERIMEMVRRIAIDIVQNAVERMPESRKTLMAEDIRRDRF